MESWALSIRIARLIGSILLLPGGLLSAQLNELRTVNLLGDKTLKIEFFQKTYSAKKEWVFQRDQLISFSLSRRVEFGLNFPHLNYIDRSGELRNRLGDTKIFFNFATDWFSKYITLNYYLEWNTGSGPKYTGLDNHPLESYGYEEWRTGLIFFKSLKKIPISIHTNLFYVFRSESEPTLFASFFNEDTLNIFAREAYNRALGFNPAHSQTFFYYKNFVNDNIELNMGFNTDIWYPFVPFLELVVHFVFSRDFPRRAPGSGIMRNQISMGTKFFFYEDQFSTKLLVTLPLPPLHTLYDVGLGLGFSCEF